MTDTPQLSPQELQHLESFTESQEKGPANFSMPFYIDTFKAINFGYGYDISGNPEWSEQFAGLR